MVLGGLGWFWEGFERFWAGFKNIFFKRIPIGGPLEGQNPQLSVFWGRKIEISFGGFWVVLGGFLGGFGRFWVVWRGFWVVLGGF